MRDCSVSGSPSAANKEMNKRARNEPPCNLPSPSFFYFSLKLPACIDLHSAVIWKGRLQQKYWWNKHKHGQTFEWLEPLLICNAKCGMTYLCSIAPAWMCLHYNRYYFDALQLLCKWVSIHANSLIVILLLCVFTAQMTTMNTDTAGNHMIHMVSLRLCFL